MPFRRIETNLVANAGSLADQARDISWFLKDSDDLDPLLDAIGDARFVLLGEASHGTSDFYVWRARLSQRLVQEKGFSFVCVEGDWPDCYRINRYIKHYPDSGANAFEVMHAFQRWPTWMWANWEVVALAEWLRLYNQDHGNRVGFYGLDVYSLWDSMHAVIDYLDRIDPQAAQTARRAYTCFEPHGRDVQDYAWNVALTPQTCENEVVSLLTELRGTAERYDHDNEASLSAEQNALVIADAEQYYRSLVRGGAESWNIRDRHMADSLDRLMEFHGQQAGAIVWAHNTHVGDARATDMARAGEFNIGQVVRERHGSDQAFLVGFGSHRGTVIAGESWDAPMEEMMVPEGVPGSWEDVMHRAGTGDKLLLLKQVAGESDWREARGHRAIGVVYNPEYERYGNYVPTVLPERYDAFLFIDESSALHPLHIEPTTTEPPELYPWGV